MYNRFLELVTNKGVRVVDVVKETGIPQSTFSDWKNGRSVPKTQKLIKIARYFGVTVEDLVGEEKEEC